MSTLMPMLSTRNTTAMSSKAMKFMGLSVQDLFENFIGLRAGILNRQEFNIYWSAISTLENPKDANLIVRLLVKYFIEISTDTSKHLPDFTLQGVLNTIFFICLYTPFKPDSLVKKFVAQWMTQVDACRKDANIVSYLDVVVVLNARLCSDEDALDTIVQNLHRMHTNVSFQLMTQEVIPTLHRRELQCPSFPFVYPFLLSQCNDKSMRLRIFDIVLGQLGRIQATPSSMRNRHSVMALLHLLRSMLSYWRAPIGVFQQVALEKVVPFFLWPLPISLAARRVLLVLKQEMLAPGNSILERFAAESRVPETSHVVNGIMIRSRPIFYVIDATCAVSSNYCLLIGLHNADTYIDDDSKMFASGLSSEVQALLLLNIIHSPSAPIDPNDIYSVTEEDVIVLFGQTVNVLQESLDISPEDAVSHRERNFALIRTQFTKVARSNECRGIASDLSLPPTLPATLMPSLPDIAHVHWVVARDYRFASPELISQLRFTPFPKTPLLDKLEKVLHLYEAFADAQDPVEVRLCIAGSDSIIHQVATAYLELMKRDSEPLKGIMLRFFLIPFRDSILSGYISRYDSWYNRHLYVPLTTRHFLVPSMAEEEPVFSESKNEDMITPFGHLLKSNIENYVREAEYTLQVKLFQIEGWRRMVAEGGAPDLIIPLVERAEIGRVATAMLFKNSVPEGTMPVLRDVKDIFRDRDFTYVPLELHVQITRVDLMGNPNPDDERRASALQEEPIPFDRISISNVPSADDPAYPPNPKDPWLEIFAKVSEHKAKLKNKYSFLIQEPLQHVTCIKLTTAREDQSFRILVDGESFGPFKQVRISRVEDESKKQISLNIATFFPIQP